MYEVVVEINVCNWNGKKCWFDIGIWMESLLISDLKWGSNDNSYFMV